MKRRGFTLIELMVVIAIIIILSAIAIPNYLKMTERAKKSRIASDMATLATGLETFKTDWGTYPVTNAAAAPAAANCQPIDSGVVGSVNVTCELGGLYTAAQAGAVNVVGAKTAAGDIAPVEYLKIGTLKSIVDPFKKATGTAATLDDGHVYYVSNGTNWVLIAYTGTSATEVYLYRTDSSSEVKPSASGLPAAY